MDITRNSTVSGPVRYRADIDGLRAVAALAVMLFHAGVDFLPGGFTGVDIFLVISGYLIGGQILDRLREGSFSLSGFWYQRVRRILPALLVMMIATLAAGWLILMPNDLKDLGRSALAQSGMASNVYFWLKTDYFAAPSFQKPLLHTWTLSLEVQFYLLAPVMLIFLYRAGNRLISAGIVLLLAGSLAASVMWTPSAPAAAFYLLPFRAWEFIFGMALAAHVLRTRSPLPAAAGVVLGVAGTALVMAGFLMLGEHTSFPGHAAMLPCLGAVCLIAAGTVPASPVTRLLALAPLAALGRASYSLYLWHWPVFVYVRYVTGNDLAIDWMMAAFAATAVLAWASYRFVELPARRAAWPRPGRRVLAACLGAVALTGLAGHIIDRGDGFSSRLPAAARQAYNGAFAILQYPEPCHTPEALDGLPVCGTAKGNDVPDVLVWGDSHSWAIAPALASLAHTGGLTYSRFQCLPVLDAYRSDQASLLDEYSCARLNQRMMEYIRTARIRRVLLVAAWSRLVEPRELRMEGAGQRDQYIAKAGMNPTSAEQAREAFAELVPRTLGQLTEAEVEVWIMKQVPQHTGWIANELAKSLIHGPSAATLSRPLSEHRTRNRFVDSVFDAVAATNPRVHVIDPTHVLCSDGTCNAAKDGEALYFDFHHLSVTGAAEVEPLLQPLFSIK